MLRLCEVLGLTVSDMTEITAFISMSISFSVFVGCCASWLLKEICKSIPIFFDLLFDSIKKIITNKRHRRDK